jgi:hypothetical protein
MTRFTVYESLRKGEVCGRRGDAFRKNLLDCRCNPYRGILYIPGTFTGFAGILMVECVMPKKVDSKAVL